MMASSRLPGVSRPLTRPLTPPSRLRRHAADAWLPQLAPAELFQQLAVVAMDAANAAGAEFADIRIGGQRGITVPQLPYRPFGSVTVGYGIRARVRGTWGFQHGCVLTRDAVATAARSATLGAARYAATNARLDRATDLPFAAVPVVTGSWRGPCEIDPFTVPIDDYYRMIGALTDITRRVHHNRGIGSFALGWQSQLRIFASTDGSLVTQEYVQGDPGIGGGASLPDNPNDGVNVDVQGLDPVLAGFECALRPELVDLVRSGMDEAVRLRELPLRPPPEMGRVPIVFDGHSMAKLFVMTIGQALDGDRVAGFEADASGDTFLAPPDEILGASTPQFSPLLSATVNRAPPSPAAVQWDDEGVAPEPYTILEHGRVMDYHMTRETVPLLAAWYRRRGRPLRPHGVAASMTPSDRPRSTSGHTFVTSSTTPLGIAELTRDMKHGFIIRGGDGWVEPSLTAGVFGGNGVEIRNGVAIARLNVPIQFATKTLLGAQLVAVGDQSTTRTEIVDLPKGIPWQSFRHVATAPAMLCKDVDVRPSVR